MGILGNLFSRNKSKVINDLYQLGIPSGKYWIYDDLSVDIYGDFTLKSEIAKKWTFCPIKFRIVYGHFIWHYGSLTSLDNMPTKVTKNFSVAYNELTSLKGSPSVVGDVFICSGNKIKNLNGCPTFVKNIYAVNCDIVSLVGAPKTVESLLISNNKLKDLSHLPDGIKTLDISNNNISSFEDILPLIKDIKKISFTGNPCEKKLKEILDNGGSISTIAKKETTEINLPFKEGDYVILNNENSKFHNFKGRVIQINLDNTYTVLFDKRRNSTLEKDGMITGVKPHLLIKDTPIFHIGDYILFNNKNSRFDGVKGEIYEKLPIDGGFQYKIKALMSENPTLKNVANQSSVERGWSHITGIVDSEMTKIEKPETTTNPTITTDSKENAPRIINGIILSDKNTFKPGDKAFFHSTVVDIIKPTSPEMWEVKYSYGTTVTLHYTALTLIHSGDTKDIILDPANKFLPGDRVNYYSQVVELVEPISPTMWKFKYSYGTHSYDYYYKFTPTEPLNYNEGDVVIIKDESSQYLNKKGTIIKIEKDDENKRQLSYDIELDATNNKEIKIINSIPKNKVQLFTPKESTTAERVFSKGDRIIYVSHKNNTTHNNCHLRKGVIDLVNTTPSLKDTYDITLDKLKDENYDKKIMNISWSNLLLLNQDFEIGDKVVVFEPTSKFHDIVGVVSEFSNEGTYKIIYRDEDNSHTLSGIKPNQLIEYHKPFGSECDVDDIVKYTKPNSKYYGCTGVVKKIKKNKDDKQYSVEITTKDKTQVNIYANDYDLETMPGPRNYKVNDRIRYINPNHAYNGYIGKISNIEKDKRSNKQNYSLILKNNSRYIYIIANSDEIELLEEAPEQESLKVGCKVRYTNANSKWTGKIGEFVGVRTKDNKTQFGVKFQEAGNIYKTIYIDEGEGTLDVVSPPEPITTPSTTYSNYNNTTNYNKTTKKKKKESEEKPREPILVYNRRQSARKAKPKKSSE